MLMLPWKARSLRYRPVILDAAAFRMSSLLMIADFVRLVSPGSAASNRTREYADIL